MELRVWLYAGLATWLLLSLVSGLAWLWLGRRWHQAMEARAQKAQELRQRRAAAEARGQTGTMAERWAQWHDLPSALWEVEEQQSEREGVQAGHEETLGTRPPGGLPL